MKTIKAIHEWWMKLLYGDWRSLRYYEPPPEGECKVRSAWRYQYVRKPDGTVIRHKILANNPQLR
jgi:hypothetical protein